MTPGIAFSPAASRWLRGEHLFWPIEKWQALQRAELALHLPRTGCHGSAQLADLCRSETPLHEILAQLPITTKDQLSTHHTSPITHHSHIREWVTTSGTSGQPLSVPLTASDLDRLAANEHVAFSVAGIQPNDVVLLLVGMDRLFVAGLAYWLGAQSLGAAAVRAGPQHASSPALLKQTIDRYRATHLVAVPSFLAACATGIFAPSTLRGIIAIGEPVHSVDEPSQHNRLGQLLTTHFGVPVLSTYASTETCATFAQSPHCTGGHLNPQMAIVEILDDNNRPVPPGTPGEVTITPLGVEGLPLLRFRTGDIAALYTNPCPCGRTTPRLGPIIGRKQQLMKVKGASIYPSAIAEALASIPEILDSVTLVEKSHDLADHLTLHITLKQDTPATRQRIESTLRALLKVLPAISYINEPALRALQFSQSARKPRRFIDLR